jgi:DNA topoisomerase-3
MRADAPQTNVARSHVKNFSFDYTFASSWGPCSVVFTSVAGHLMRHDFGPPYNNWQAVDPGQLLDAPIHKSVAEVSLD